MGKNRTERVTFLVTEKEAKELAKIAATLEESVSGACRKMIFSEGSTAYFSPEIFKRYVLAETQPERPFINLVYLTLEQFKNDSIFEPRAGQTVAATKELILEYFTMAVNMAKQILEEGGFDE